MNGTANRVGRPPASPPRMRCCSTTLHLSIEASVAAGAGLVGSSAGRSDADVDAVDHAVHQMATPVPSALPTAAAWSLRCAESLQPQPAAPAASKPGSASQLLRVSQETHDRHLPPSPPRVASADAFAALFEESLKSNDMRVGEVISAEVVRIEFNHVVVNAGLKSESYVAIEEFKNDQGELEVQVGDFVSVAIDAVENGYGDTILSRDKAKRLASLDEPGELAGVRRLRHRHGQRQGQGRPHGAGQRHPRLPAGFSLLDTRPVKDMTPFEGKTMEFKVIKLDRKRNNVVLSRRAVVEASMGEERAQAAGNSLRRRHRQRRGQEHHRIRCVRRPGRHRRPAAHHRHGLAPRAPPERGWSRSARN